MLRHRQQMQIAMSHCDQTLMLGVPQTFGLLLDLATEHSETLGIGTRLIREKGVFWLTARTRVTFHRRPALGETIRCETWFGQVKGAHSTRFYRIERDGECLVEAETRFVAVEAATGQPIPVSAFMETDGMTEQTPEEPSKRIDADFSGCPALAEYRVRSVDIDVGGHMNNTAYVWALAGALDSRWWKTHLPKSVEMVYRQPVLEGETLTLMRRDIPGGLEVGFLRGGVPAAMARVLERE